MPTLETFQFEQHVNGCASSIASTTSAENWSMEMGLGTMRSQGSCRAEYKVSEDSSPTINMHFDRPFLFAIRNVSTGALLFMGRVADPAAES